MKTSEEIKKGLDCCSKGKVCTGNCVYEDFYSYPKCKVALEEDAIDRIKQLETALLLMVYQYCNDGDSVNHRYMSAGEHAFAALGIENHCSVEKIEKMLDEMRCD